MMFQFTGSYIVTLQLHLPLHQGLLSNTVSGQSKRPTNQPTNTHTHAQCSQACVGLVQPHLSKHSCTILVVQIQSFYKLWIPACKASLLTPVLCSMSQMYDNGDQLFSRLFYTIQFLITSNLHTDGEKALEQTNGDQYLVRTLVQVFLLRTPFLLSRQLYKIY